MSIKLIIEEADGRSLDFLNAYADDLGVSIELAASLILVGEIERRLRKIEGSNTHRPSVSMIAGYDLDGKEILLHPYKIQEVYKGFNYLNIKMDDGTIHRFGEGSRERVYKSLQEIHLT